MRRSSSCILGLALLTSSVAWAEPPPSNGYIGIFGDATGSSCCFSLPAQQNGNDRFYIYYVTGGAGAAGISGAEFKLSIEPASPGTWYRWEPDNNFQHSSGDVVDNGSGGGGSLSSNQCQTQTGLAGDKILLGAVRVRDLYDEHLLKVKGSDNPSNPNFACPSVFLCDGPAFTQVALTLRQGDPALGGEDPVGFVSTVNPSSCNGSSCGFVAVEKNTWSLVKGLFR